VNFIDSGQYCSEDFLQFHSERKAEANTKLKARYAGSSTNESVMSKYEWL